MSQRPRIRRKRASISIDGKRVRIHNRDVFAWMPSGLGPKAFGFRRTKSAPKGEDLVLVHRAGDRVRRVSPLTRQEAASLIQARKWRAEGVSR